MADLIPLVVHATHEAGVKVGGIGAVLDGLLGAGSYAEQVKRTIVVGPMNAADPIEMERLTSPRNKLTIRYSSLHAVYDGVQEPIRRALQQVEQTFEVALLYGTRAFGAQVHEVILVDVTNPNQGQINNFKFDVWRNYGFDSSRYGWAGELNLFMAVAPPLFAAMRALGAGDGLSANDKFIIAHEWLGMPLVFAAQMTEPEGWRTVFYAHEMATVRRLVEENPGHDTAFYNAMIKAQEWGLDLETVYGDQSDLFKHPLIQLAIRCDNIFAVGDLVVDELRFLGGDFRSTNIDLVYNGIPATRISLAEKLASKRRLQQYGQNLLGYTPDYVFTHVSRLVLSKAFWRDFRVLDHVDAILRERGQRAVLFILSTSLPAGRRPEWVLAWEAQYGWPVNHRSDNGDLVDNEANFYFDALEPFNQRATNTRAVLVNQFGWSRDRCGNRMPEEMEFMDIRKGSDLEFGQSIYEPFGIAQVETLGFGALCCVSNVCGCVGFARKAAGSLEELPNLVVADYCSLPGGYWINSPYDAIAIDRGVRDWIEGNNSGWAAQTIIDRLPRTPEEMQAMLERGQAIAQRMSWEVVTVDYLLPGLRRAMRP
jgi:hypothetical protein